MSSVNRCAGCASCWQRQRSSSLQQWESRMRDPKRQEELRARFRKPVGDRMHRAKAGHSRSHLGMTARSGAIDHLQQQAEELKSQLFTAGGMTCPSNRRQDQRSAPDLARAKSVKTMRGTALSSWRRKLKKMRKAKLAQRALVIAFGRRSSPRASRCRETPPSTIAR